jgi:hypothetical protein
LYRLISEDAGMAAVTVSEGLAKIQPTRLARIFPGSWINANFDVWIGAEEDNEAWTYLLRAHETYETAHGVAQDRKRLAYEELLIAEGSDWCWWYGPEHDSPDRPQFDELYRSHLANVYRFLDLAPPEELSRPILRVSERALQVLPGGPIHPVVDGEVTSYFEWLGAGSYRVDHRSGSMHGTKHLVREVLYGRDSANLFVRVDFDGGGRELAGGIEAHLSFRAGQPFKTSRVTLRLENGRVTVGEASLAVPEPATPVEFAFRRILEGRLALSALGAKSDGPVGFQLSLWQSGLPIEAVPQQGWIEMAAVEGDWAG